MLPSSSDPSSPGVLNPENEARFEPCRRLLFRVTPSGARVSRRSRNSGGRSRNSVGSATPRVLWVGVRSRTSPGAAWRIHPPNLPTSSRSRRRRGSCGSGAPRRTHWLAGGGRPTARRVCRSSRSVGCCGFPAPCSRRCAVGRSRRPFRRPNERRRVRCLMRSRSRLLSRRGFRRCRFRVDVTVVPALPLLIRRSSRSIEESHATPRRDELSHFV